MDDQLVSLLEYDGVLSALATTRDGLVVAASGLSGDDAEIVGAAGSMLFGSLAESPGESSAVSVGSSALHLMRDTELSLVVLTEAEVRHDLLAPLMEETLSGVTKWFA